MARSPPQSFWEQVPGLGQELASQLRWTALRSLKAAWKKTLVLQGEVPERAACVLCWKSLTWDAWSPGEAALFPSGASSQSHRWPLANGHGGSARPGPAQQRCAQLQRPSSNSAGEQRGGESTPRSRGHLHWNRGHCWDGREGGGRRGRGCRGGPGGVGSVPPAGRTRCGHDSQNCLD